MAHDKSREIRFGLVLYGGVSLAVYINGVVTEFLRMVRGNGVYQLVKWLTDTEIIVDIVSGTSAGGINGVFFAHALVNQLDFVGMERLWRNAGDIGSLLRPLDGDAKSYKSLLDSEGYYQRNLKNAISTLDPYHGPAIDLSDFELDLFVTGTDVDGDVYTILDDQGEPIDVKDHRSVFWLKHRPYRTAFLQNDDTHEALARLSRLTSCFPGAFAPVNVKETDIGADGLLQDWGQLNREAYFLDGGVLANKPFSHTIQAIFSRPITCPSSRILCYIEPDPERFADRSVHDPDFLAATLEGAYNIPTYQSIAQDLKVIAEHNSQVDRYRQVCRNLKGKLAPLFRNGELATGAGLPATLKDPERTTYVRSRLACVGMRAIRGLATHKGQKTELDDARKHKAKDLIKELIDLDPRPRQPGQRPVLTDSDSLDRFDVYFRLRRLHHVLYYIAAQSENTVISAEWRELRARLNTCTQFLEIIRFWMEYIMDNVMDVDGGPGDWRNLPGEDIWGNIRWYLEEFLERSRILIAAPITPAQLHSRLRPIAVEVSELTPDGNFRDPFVGLLAWRDQAEQTAFIGDGLEDFLREYDQFVSLDAVVFPLEFVSDLEGRDFIHILRLSPVDSKLGFSKRELKDKLAGVSLAHFGGFFKRSWRSNDIMWGRLDAICKLLKETINSAQIEAAVADLEIRERIRERIGPDCGRIREMFPHASEGTCHTLFDWILSVLHPQSRHAALERTEEMVERLIEMAQLEVLFECLPKIIGDKEYERELWTSGWSDDELAKTAGDAAEVRARALYTEAVPSPDPAASKMAVAFRDYKIGSTDLIKAMPLMVVTEICSRAALVLRRCIVGALDPKSRAAGAASALFSFVDKPLRLIQWLAQLSGREPRLGVVFQLTLFVVSLTTLALTYVAGWKFASDHALTCVFLPLFILLFQYFLAKAKLGALLNGLSMVAGIAMVVVAYLERAWIEANVPIIHALAIALHAFRTALT